MFSPVNSSTFKKTQALIASLFVQLTVKSMQQIFEGPGCIVFTSVYTINAYYAEMFSFFISHCQLTPESYKGYKCANGNSFSNQWVFTMLETKVFKYFYIAKTMLCISLKFVQLMTNK